MIYYYTYKITCLKGSLKGHYYLGQHKTKDIPSISKDYYYGGGKIIRDYYKKYGKVEGETYIKEIIQFYNNKEELNNAEQELIGDKFKNDPLCLNLKSGGNQNIRYSDETLEKMSSWERTEEMKTKIGETQKGRKAWNKGLKGYRLGIKKTEETKQKMRKPKSEEARTNMREANKKLFKGRHWVIDENGKRKWI